MKEPIGWQADQCIHPDTGKEWYVLETDGGTVARVIDTKRPLVDKRHAQLMARAGRMQAAIKAVITSLDTGGESSRTLAREIAILRQSLK